VLDDYLRRGPRNNAGPGVGHQPAGFLHAAAPGPAPPSRRPLPRSRRRGAVRRSPARRLR
jgi:hypothetical protein